jgi:hypothetical protein
MDEAEDLSVSGSGRWVASRRADHRQDGLVCLPARGARCRHREAHYTAHNHEESPEPLHNHLETVGMTGFYLPRPIPASILDHSCCGPAYL